MAKIITFAHNKGGTGKTTSCINVAGFLAKAGRKALVVDLDTQGNATSGLGIDKSTLDKSMYHVMGKQLSIIEPILLDTKIENIHLAPANSELTLARLDPYAAPSDALVLSKSLHGVKNHYDYILIDTPPSNYPLIINGIAAAHHVILALDPGVFAVEGIEEFNNSLKDVNEQLRLNPKADMAILTKAEISLLPFLKKHPTHEIKNELQKMFSNVYIVPHSIDIYESHRKGLPLSHCLPKGRAGKAYQRITNAVLKL